jgi:hypothetical protein
MSTRGPLLLIIAPLVGSTQALWAQVTFGQAVPLEERHLPLLLMGFVLLAVVAGLFHWMNGRQRQRDMQALADRLELSFSPDTDTSLDGYLGFPVLCQGDERQAWNIMEGFHQGFAVLAFDYRYSSGSGKNRRTTRLTVAVITSAFPLQPLLIRPEGFFDQVAEFFGFDDIDFELAEFNDRYFVKGPNKRWAYDLLHQRAMEFLLQRPRMSLEMDTSKVIVWSGSVMTVPQLEQAIGTAIGLLELVPDYVKESQRKQRWAER